MSTIVASPDASAEQVGARASRMSLVPVALLLLCALLVLGRYRTIDEAVERDIATYAVMGHEFLLGETLYVDLPDQKPPGILLTYALAEVVFGYGPRAVFAINIFFGLFTLLGVFAASRFAGMRRETALLAAGAWALVSGDFWLQANQPNSEVCLNALLTWGFACSVRNLRERWRPSFAIATGACFALATIYKPNVIVGCALLPIVGVLLAWRSREARIGALKQLGVVAAIGAGSWAALFAMLAWMGSLQAFLNMMLVYNTAYAGSTSGNLARVLTPSYFMPWVMEGAYALAATSALGLLLGLRQELSSWGLWLTYAIATIAHVALPGHFFPHYYQLWIPVLCMGGAWGVEAVHKRIGRKAVTASVAVLLVAHVASTELLQWTVPPAVISQIKVRWLYPYELRYGDIFLETRRTARDLDRILANGEEFYQWGLEAGLYYYSKRRPPSRILWSSGAMDGPMAQQFTLELIEDLQRNRPELFVMTEDYGRLEEVNHPALVYVREHYRPYPDHPRKHFRLYMLKNGRLEARVQARLAH